MPAGTRTVHFETQLSHARTSFLWDCMLNMQPHLTCSATLSMAASATTMLASDVQTVTHGPQAGYGSLLNTVASQPQQLPSRSYMSQDPGCSMLRLSVAVASGSMSISFNGIPQMQSHISQAGSSGCSSAEPECPAEGSLALAHVLWPFSCAQALESSAATFACAASLPQDASGYSLHPAAIEIPVSLAALAQQARATPTWLKAATATYVSAAPATIGHTAHTVSGLTHSVKAVTMEHQLVLQQEGTAFASGLALAGDAASSLQQQSAEAAPEVRNGQEAADRVVSENSAMLQMDDCERKLFIQAQVYTCFLNQKLSTSQSWDEHQSEAVALLSCWQVQAACVDRTPLHGSTGGRKPSACSRLLELV